MYDGMEHYCLEDNHIVNLFSFSKAYGMMGWRVGYVSTSRSSFTFCLCFTIAGGRSQC
jgi:aspartate/methionine/tyrosine aminotransferase